MVKKARETKVTKEVEASYEMPSGSALRTVFDVDEIALTRRKINEFGHFCFIPENDDEHERFVRLLRAMEHYEGLAPSDAAEGMLAQQMVGAHEAAQECLRRAALTGQTFEGRQAALKQAEKLMSLYVKQLAALDKHRGKGQQKVTVEHVNVASGGQAIVGNVSHGGGAQQGITGEVPKSDDTPLPETTPQAAKSRKRSA